MKTFELKVIAMDKVFYKGECELLVFPAVDGEQGVMADHEPMVSAVKAGELRYHLSGAVRSAAVGDGMIEITKNGVVILCDFAEYPEEIDILRAERAKERAEERLKIKESNKEYIHSQAALSRAMARLKVTSKAKRI
ncbi:MAG: ATP synthase F1 subunit epsilon [Clostridia bacterium]|nr:ATP synthase F1 subunit epsilon [Clostridia bacterium]